MCDCSIEDTIRGRIRIGSEGSNRLGGLPTSSGGGIYIVGRTLVVRERERSLKLGLEDSGTTKVW